MAGNVCRWCGREFTAGHLLEQHAGDWHRQLEAEGMSELQAHLRIIAWARSRQAVGR